MLFQGVHTTCGVLPYLVNGNVVGGGKRGQHDAGRGAGAVRDLLVAHVRPRDLDGDENQAKHRGKRGRRNLGHGDRTKQNKTKQETNEARRKKALSNRPSKP